MYSRISRLGLGLTAALAACAMARDNLAAPRCRIVGGDALPAASGGAPALCAAVVQAVRRASGGQAYSIEVRVRTRFLEAAVTMRDGPLPLLHFAENDRAVTASTFGRFAAAITRHIVIHRDRGAAPTSKIS